MEKTLQEIQSFIETDLPKKLQKDLHNLHIVKEADVECSAYFHMRKFIGNSQTWRILARKHTPKTGHYIDLLIFEGITPKIAIELKWGKRQITPKDAHSLETALMELRVNKAYWISVLSTNDNESPQNICSKKNYVAYLVSPSLDNNAFKEWKENRKNYRSNMQKGNGRTRNTPIQ